MSSDTHFRVEYPPDKMKISKEVSGDDKFDDNDDDDNDDDYSLWNIHPIR